MADKNQQFSEANQYEALVNQVNENVSNGLTTGSDEAKISWEEFTNTLSKDSIKPILERDEAGQIELNYKVENFNFESYQHEQVKVKGVDLEIHNIVLEQIETAKPVQALVEREQVNEALIENVQQGQKIEVAYNNQNLEFRVPNNPDLTEKLNALPQDQALGIVEKTNTAIDNKLDSTSLSFEEELKIEELGRKNGLSL